MLSRVFLSLCLLAGALAGCRPADPLDWKITAKTPENFDEWSESDLVRLPDREREEFNRAFTFIASTSPRGMAPKEMNETNNPLCRRLHGRTIRSVILEGYDLEKRTLYARISTESDNILRNAQLADKTDDAEKLARIEKIRVSQKANIDMMTLRLREIEHREKELLP